MRSRRETSLSVRASSSKWRSSFSVIRTNRRTGTATGAIAVMPGNSSSDWPESGCGCAITARRNSVHYSCGTADIEYAFPFLPPGEFGELEGIAHRGDFDLRSHMEGKLVRKGNRSGRGDDGRTESRDTKAAARI